MSADPFALLGLDRPPRKTPIHFDTAACHEGYCPLCDDEQAQAESEQS